MRYIFLFVIALGVCPLPLSAGEIKQGDAVRAILGEAEGEGYEGMLAVACALRNRGHLKGVYGLNAKRPNTPGLIPQYLWRMAEKAWRESAVRDITNGANHWHNTEREGENYWTRAYELTVVIGSHYFYRG